MTSAPVRSPGRSGRARAVVRAEEARLELADAREQEPREDDARARREIERDRLELVDRRSETITTLRTLPRAPMAMPRRNRSSPMRRRRGDRDEPDVGLVLGERARDLAGDRALDREAIARRARARADRGAGAR